MNEHARRYAKPHFRKVERRERTLIKAPVVGEARCLVCALPLPPTAHTTFQFFHGECRKYRILMRRL